MQRMAAQRNNQGSDIFGTGSAFRAYQIQQNNKMQEMQNIMKEMHEKELMKKRFVKIGNNYLG